MNYKNLYLLQKRSLFASLALFVFSAHAQVTDQDVVDDLPELSNGTFIIGAAGAFDVAYDSSITLSAWNANSSLTFQNDSDYTASNDDIILYSEYGFTPTLNISSGIIDLGTSNGEITGKANSFGGNGTSYVNITGGMVNMRRFKADGVSTGNVNLIVNISGSGTSVFSNDADANVNNNDTIDITVSDGAIYSLSGSGSAFGIKNYTIEDGGTLESRGTWTLSSLDSFNFESGGTLQLGGAVSGLPSITSGQTVVLDGGSFGDATTLDGGTVAVNDFNLATDNLIFSSGTLEASGSLTNLPTISSGHVVDITGGGSFGDATTLDGGTVAVNDFNLATSNLTFTSGTLESSGILTGLTTLATGATARMNGSSAVALQLNETLTLDGGTLEITNGASANPIGSGSIAFGASGGEIALNGGTLNVASMNSGLHLDANASITGNGEIFGSVDLGVGGAIEGDLVGLNLYGDVSGTGTLADVTVYGNVDIGNSPGELELQGTTLASGTVTMEIYGTGVGEYDMLIGDEFSDVSGATLEISFIGYTPIEGDSWQLVSGGMDPLSFNGVNTPEDFTLSSNGTFTAIPETATIFMFATFALAAVIGLRRR